MQALVYLSRYQDTYNTWKEIKEKYRLKWTLPDALKVSKSNFNNEKNYILQPNWLKYAIAQIPKSCAKILIYTTPTRLRPVEACQSIALIQNGLKNYQVDKMILGHYLYPESIFVILNRSSFQLWMMLLSGQESVVCGYNAMRNYLVRLKLGMNEYFIL